MINGTVISPSCECVEKWGPPIQFCGLPTVAGYPAMGGGWAGCCVEHVQPHVSYAWPIEDIQSGVAEAAIANGSRG